MAGKSHGTIRDEVEAYIQDTGNVDYAAGDLDKVIRASEIELSAKQPSVSEEFYFIETRTGSASSTSANNLVDSSESQFLAEDVGKVVHNVTDNEWARINSFSSTSQVGLSHDIMESGDEYRIYNEGCRAQNQIYLGTERSFVGDDENWGVEQVEFRTQQVPPELRDFSVRRGVLSIDVGTLGLEDSKTVTSLTEVIVQIRRVHFASELTDLAGAINNSGGYQKGDVSIAIDGLGATDTILHDAELTFLGLRGVYRVIDDVTLSSGGGTIEIWPPLETSVADDLVLNFSQSTMNRDQETRLIQLAAGRAVISQGALYLRQAELAKTAQVAVMTELDKVDDILVEASLQTDKMDDEVVLANAEVVEATGLLSSEANTQSDLITAEVVLGQTATTEAKGEADLITAVVILASAEIDKVAKLVDTAAGTLALGRNTINTINIGGPNVPAQYAGQAAAELSTSLQHLRTGQGYLAEAVADAQSAEALINAASANFATARGFAAAAGSFHAQVLAHVEAAAGFVGTARGYGLTAQGFFAEAAGYVEQGLAYAQKATVDLAIVDRVPEFTAWGRREVREALEGMEIQTEPNVDRPFPVPYSRW